jgi:class 3 adenylate cyclase
MVLYPQVDMTNLVRGIGVRGRLLLAFFGISTFAVLGAVAALFTFAEIGSVVGRLAREQMPASFAALELSRQAERIAALAPKLLTDASGVEQVRTDRTMRKEIANLEKLLTQIKGAQQDHPFISEVERSVTEIRVSLRELYGLRDGWAETVGNSGTAWPPPEPVQARGNYVPAPGELLAKGQKLLQKNDQASARLTATVNRFIDHERTEIARAEAEVVSTQRRSTGVLLGVVALSLVSSALIVWLYVDRSIIARLTALSGSMRSIAGGNLQTPLPSSARHDEIAHMAEALRVFRDTAIEKERMGRLKRFLAPQVAELIVSTGDERILDSHRRDVAVLFCDLRGFTAFAEAAEPEEVMELLREYYSCLGQLVHKFAGTLERFTGDGLFVLFNDPLPCADPCLTAARLAVEMRASVNELVPRWRQLGSPLGFGIGIAYGYATLGRVGYEDRFDYTAIGSVVNLAARLCERAQADEILIDSRVQAAIEGRMEAKPLGKFKPKGFSRPIEVFNIAVRRDNNSSGPNVILNPSRKL